MKTEGSIYNFEKREERKRSIALLNECKNKCKKVIHIVKDPHTGETSKRVQLCRE